MIAVVGTSRVLWKRGRVIIILFFLDLWSWSRIVKGRRGEVEVWWRCEHFCQPISRSSLSSSFVHLTIGGSSSTLVLALFSTFVRLLQLLIIQPRFPVSNLPILLFTAFVIRIVVRQSGIVYVVPLPDPGLLLVFILLPLILLGPRPVLLIGVRRFIVLVDPVLELTALCKRPGSWGIAGRARCSSSVRRTSCCA